MGNFFDQFDAGANAPATAPAGNYFDQFDATAAPDAQAAPAAPAQSGGGVWAGLSDILPEMGQTALAHVANIRNMYGGSQENGPIQQTLNVGKGLGSLVGILPDTLIGAPARSILGHGMADTEHAIGTVIAPQTAAQDNPQEMYDTAKGNVDTAMMGLAPRGASPLGIRPGVGPTVAATPSIADLKAAATAGYDATRNMGLEIKPQSFSNFTAGIQGDLNASGINETLAPKTFKILSDLGNPPAGATVTIDNVRTLQRTLGNAAKSPDPTEGLAARTAINGLNDHIENLSAGDLVRGTPQDAAAASQAIKEANANYAAYRRSQDFDLRGQRAQNNSDAHNSGMNLENNLRTQVRQILNNPRLQRGYDADTLAAFKDFNGGSRSANIVRAVGNALGGGGGWGSLAAAAIGHMVMPGAGEALPLVGFAVKAAANARAASQFDKLASMIRARSPLGRSMPPVAAPPALLSASLPAAALTSRRGQ